MKLRFNRDYKKHQGEILWPALHSYSPKSVQTLSKIRLNFRNQTNLRVVYMWEGNLGFMYEKIKGSGFIMSRFGSTHVYPTQETYSINAALIIFSV